MTACGQRHFSPSEHNGEFPINSDYRLAPRDGNYMAMWGIKGEINAFSETTAQQQQASFQAQEQDKVETASSSIAMINTDHADNQNVVKGISETHPETSPQPNENTENDAVPKYSKNQIEKEDSVDPTDNITNVICNEFNQ